MALLGGGGVVKRLGLMEEVRLLRLYWDPGHSFLFHHPMVSMWRHPQLYHMHQRDYDNGP